MLLEVCLNCSKQNVFIPKADATKEVKQDMAEKLKLSAGTSKFHLALDSWTSTNCFNFLAITCHFIDDDWRLCEHLLSFDDIVDHSGDGMASTMFDVLKRNNLIEKLGCISADNASLVI
jgi:hypothetical protein